MRKAIRDCFWDYFLRGEKVTKCSSATSLDKLCWVNCLSWPLKPSYPIDCRLLGFFEADLFTGVWSIAGDLVGFIACTSSIPMQPPPRMLFFVPMFSNLGWWDSTDVVVVFLLSSSWKMERSVKDLTLTCERGILLTLSISGGGLLGESCCFERFSLMMAYFF